MGLLGLNQATREINGLGDQQRQAVPIPWLIHHDEMATKGTGKTSFRRDRIRAETHNRRQRTRMTMDETTACTSKISAEKSIEKQIQWPDCWVASALWRSCVGDL